MFLRRPASTLRLKCHMSSPNGSSPWAEYPLTRTAVFNGLRILERLDESMKRRVRYGFAAESYGIAHWVMGCRVTMGFSANMDVCNLTCRLSGVSWAPKCRQDTWGAIGTRFSEWVQNGAASALFQVERLTYYIRSWRVEVVRCTWQSMWAKTLRS